MSLAKNFENLVREQLGEIDNSYVLRLYDVQSGFSGVNTVCDLLFYKEPNLFMLELKTTKGNTLPLSNIRDNQFDGLYDAMKKADGIIAGLLVWFYDKDVTLFFPINLVHKRKNEGAKSLRFDDNEAIKIDGKKKRTYFVYDFTNLLEVINE